MIHGFPRPTELAQAWIREVLGAGDVAVDATTGNGYDTRFLADSVTASGLVHAFDVQQLALNAAKIHCDGYGQIHWHLASHAVMEQYVSAARAVMFNLGYLPGADHQCMTHAHATLAAIAAACRILLPGGRITIVCYPGHAGGDEETAAVLAHVAAYGAGWQIVKYEKLATRKAAPILIGLEKQRTFVKQ
jgi:predicted methyltransferase